MRSSTNIIYFNGEEFKARELMLNEQESVLISTENLNSLLTNDTGNYLSEEARVIDEQIFYYVADAEIEFEEEDIIKMLTQQVQ